MHQSSVFNVALEYAIIMYLMLLYVFNVALEYACQVRVLPKTTRKFVIVLALGFKSTIMCLLCKKKVFIKEKRSCFYALYYYDYFFQTEFPGSSDQIHQKLHVNCKHTVFFGKYSGENPNL